MPSAKPVWPCSVRSCRTLFKRSGSLWWAMWFWMLDVFATPQQETNVARPRPVFRARTVITPLGFGCARLATLAFAPPHPRGVMTEGRKTIYRKTFTPTNGEDSMDKPPPEVMQQSSLLTTPSPHDFDHLN